MADQLDFLTLDRHAGAQRTQDAIERADATIKTAPHGDELVGRVTARLRQMCREASCETFSGDDIAFILDQMGVARDQATRKRVVSTIVNRGRKTLWTPDGWTTSADPRRHGRPLMRWRWAIVP